MSGRLVLYIYIIWDVHKKSNEGLSSANSAWFTHFHGSSFAFDVSLTIIYCRHILFHVSAAYIRLTDESVPIKLYFRLSFYFHISPLVPRFEHTSPLVCILHWLNNKNPWFNSTRSSYAIHVGVIYVLTSA